MPRAKATPTKNASTRRYASRKSSGGTRSSYRRYPYRSYYSSYRRNPPKPFTLPQFAVAQMDPFDPAARGVRVPDESTAPSSSFKLYDQSTIGPTGTGNNNAAMTLFFPNVQRYAKKQATTSTPTTIAWDTTWQVNTDFPSKRASVVQQYSVSRPVAHAIRLACPLAPTTVTGFAHIALLTVDLFGADGDNPSALATAGKLPTTVGDMRELPHYRRLTLASLTQEPLTVVNKYLDTTAFRYTSTQSDELTSLADGQEKGTFHVPSSWMVIVVMIEGHGQTPGTTVLTAENICHFEGQTKTAGLNADDTAETANPDAFDGTSSAAGQSRSSWFTSEQPGAMSEFVSNLQSWMANFGRTATRTAARDVGRAAANFGRKYVSSALAGMGMPGINNLGRLNM